MLACLFPVLLPSVVFGARPLTKKCNGSVPKDSLQKYGQESGYFSQEKIVYKRYLAFVYEFCSIAVVSHLHIYFNGTTLTHIHSKTLASAIFQFVSHYFHSKRRFYKKKRFFIVCRWTKQKIKFFTPITHVHPSQSLV